MYSSVSQAVVIGIFDFAGIVQNPSVTHGSTAGFL
jgi:hypothetical protein